MNIVYKSRVFLVRFAKVFPFILCFIVCISYVESVYALANENFYAYGNDVVLYKPFSWLISEYFIYNWYTILAATVLSFAMETCWYNKVCVVYLCFNAWERDYFITIELYPEYIYAICIANILICGFFCHKGIKILLSSRKQ